LGLQKKGCVVGVDLGGTWIRAALFNKKGGIIEKTRERVDRASEHAIGSQISRMARSLCHRSHISLRHLDGIGIASAGPLDLKIGRIVRPPNLPFDQVPIVGPVTEELSVPVYLINDCTAAVLGEREFGAGKGIENLVYITIGTGIGGGAIVNGHLLWGKDGNAAEVGHFTIDSQERLPCGCGKRGHWEAYCSGSNIPNFVRLRIRELRDELAGQSTLLECTKGCVASLTSEDLFAAARSGDKLALRLVEELGALNAMGFANVINAYDPSLITAGGSVVLKNENLVLPYIKDKVKNYAVNRLPRILLTSLGEDVGICGAVAAVRELKQ
jgi:glucokinase